MKISCECNSFSCSEKIEVDPIVALRIHENGQNIISKNCAYGPCETGWDSARDIVVSENSNYFVVKER